MKEYYCLKDTFCNKQYFVRGRRYTEDEVLAGLGRRDKEQELSKYLVQIRPKMKEKTPEQQKIIKWAAQELKDQMEEIRDFGTTAPAAMRRMSELESTLELVEAI